MVSGVNGAHGRSVAKAAMVEKQQEPEIAIVLLHLTVLGTHNRLRIVMSKIVLLMVNGVNGAHGRLVAKPATEEKQQEAENAMIQLLPEVGHIVMVTRNKLTIAMLNHALLMVNGVSGAHGRVVPRPVVVEKQQEPENATIQLLLMVDLTAMVTPRILKNAWLKLAQVIF